MAIYFMGGEPADFTLKNDTYFTQDGSYFRTDYSRGAVYCFGTTADMQNSFVATLSQPLINFWFTAQVVFGVNASLSSGFITFMTFNDGANKRIGLQVNDQRQMRIVRFNDGVTSSIVATSPGAVIPNTAIHKLDIKMVYGTSGSIEVYLDQALAFSYSGDTTAGGSTTIDHVAMGSINSAYDGKTYWSEVIVANRDTRTFMLRTHTPNSTSAASTWSGSHTDINETFPNDGTVVTTNHLDDVARFGLTDLPTHNLAIRAFKVTARVSRGENGPAHVALGVASANTATYATELPVTTGWSEVSNIWETNPLTTQPWTQGEINALEIDLKAKP